MILKSQACHSKEGWSINRMYNRGSGMGARGLKPPLVHQEIDTVLNGI